MHNENCDSYFVVLTQKTDDIKIESHTFSHSKTNVV